MSADCGGVCARIMLIIFNILYLMLGGCILGVGIWFKVEPGAYQFEEVKLLGNTVFGNKTFEVSVWVLIAFGAVIFLFGIFGIIATILESVWMLGLYIIILVVLFAMEVAGGVLAIVYKDNIKSELKIKLKALVEKHYYKLDTDNTTWILDEEGSFVPTDEGKVLNFIQVEFQCCGIDHYREYAMAGYDFPETYDLTVPYSCCILYEDKYKNSNNASDVIDNESCQALNYTRGFNKSPCFEQAERWLEEKEVIMIGIAFGIAAFQIFGFIFAVCLCTVAKRNDDDD